MRCGGWLDWSLSILVAIAYVIKRIVDEKLPMTNELILYIQVFVKLMEFTRKDLSV